MARVEDLIELERRPSTPAEILATFAESETPPSCTPSPAGGGRGLELLEFLCLAMLIYIRSDLLGKD